MNDQTPAPPPYPPPYPPSYPPRLGAHVYDPLAVGLGNASLLGLGYFMMGRRKLAVAAVTGSAVLVSVLVSVARPWCEIAVLGWWVAVVAHGWYAAGRGAGGRHGLRGPALRKRRLIALGVTVPVLLGVGLLRYDASRIERSVDEARESGDCARVLAAQGRVWFGHRAADAPLTARGDRTVDACQRLRTAKGELTAGSAGDIGELKAGFDTLSSVLAEPGNDRTAGVVLDGFLDGVPEGKNPCDAVTVTDWLSNRPPTRDALDRSRDAARRAAPAALVGCGDDLTAARDWAKARTNYQRLLDGYPGHELAADARKGVRKATLTIELAHVRGLLEDTTGGTRADYCSKPAKYSGAPPYRKGVNRAMFTGNDEYTDKLPARWRTTDAARAVLVVCADDDKNGDGVQTCPYENKLTPNFPRNVTFHKIAIPVKVYELRTGKLVADRRVQISGTSCPRVLSYTTYGPTDFGPPSDQYVKASKDDVRSAFEPLIDR
ncbi:hypothetical protein [Streptomyces sp. NPDC050428]|uniref:hypothetical protein n=1 Tax=Streptomyces sp. NPDC050428 TaxID=3155757 RepID=UPI00342879C1